MMELVWVLMYTVVTWAGAPGDLKRYEPRWQKMPSHASCIQAKGVLREMATRERMFQGMRCEELELPIQN